MKDFSQAYFWQKNPLIYSSSLLAFRAPILHSSARRKLIAILLQLLKLNASFKLSGLESPIVTLFKEKLLTHFLRSIYLTQALHLLSSHVFL